MEFITVVFNLSIRLLNFQVYPFQIFLVHLNLELIDVPNVLYSIHLYTQFIDLLRKLFVQVVIAIRKHIALIMENGFNQLKLLSYVI